MTCDAVLRRIGSRVRLDFYRRLAAAQLRAWDHTLGWCYWSYKLQADTPELDAWDMGKTIELGYLPENLSDATVANRA